MKKRIEDEIKCLKRIINKVESMQGECEHEKGELYALEWVFTLICVKELNNEVAN